MGGGETLFSAFSLFLLRSCFTRHSPAIKTMHCSFYSHIHSNFQFPISNMSSPLLLLLFLLSSAFFSVRGCPPHELKALLRFRSAVNDTHEQLESWKGHDCCSWRGVECSGSEEGRHVSKLDLNTEDIWFENVSGGIDSSLTEFKHLNYLALSGNYFHGEIPSRLGNLSSLRHLYLYCHMCRSSNLNWLSNLSSLEYLSLMHVNVSDKSWGSVVGSLLHLKHLALSYSYLPTSIIPSIFFNLSSLIYLGLSGNSFSSIPAWMGKPSSLTHLDFSKNNISGSIQNYIENLTGIEYLDLSHNSLIGEIPLSLGHNRRQYGSFYYLSLWDNNLEGTIPSSLGLLTNLTYLDLGSNRLRGNIPASLGNLHKLKTLYMDDNHLTGSLPSSLGKLHKLEILYLANNQLNGSLPLSFAHLSSLQILVLSENIMNGTITEVFFQQSLKLIELNLSYSGLSINISSTWIPSFQLTYLILKKCQIRGSIPSWISTQFRLSTLDLSRNQLTGNLPSWLWDIEQVLLSDNHLEGSFTPISGLSKYLDLSKNELSGPLPDDIHVHLSNVEVLNLASNKFEGKIPTSIANLRYISCLDMSNNRLKGSIPAALGNFSFLQVLNLENNSLKGEIPKELGTLSHLQSLRIGMNSFQGALPLFFTNFSRLQVLDVGGNNLIGTIPQWIANFSLLHVLVMRSNNFKGNLPPEIGRLANLQVLDLSSNSFSCVIPHSYFRLPAMQNSFFDGERLTYYSFEGSYSYSDNVDLIIKGLELHYEYILSSLTCFDLSNNRLIGHLLHEIGNLKGLMYLNLSRNNLNGSIPESLGNILYLESLDLSLNKFSGRIPSQIGTLSHLAYLNLSYNELFGRIPEQGGQMATFEESSYKENPNLWGCPLQRNCSHPFSRFSDPSIVYVKRKREEGFEYPWYWMCFGLAVGVGFSGVVMVLMWKLSWRDKYFELVDKVIEVMDRVICKVPKPKPLWR